MRQAAPDTEPGNAPDGAAGDAGDAAAAAGPERRCIVTRRVLPKAALIRFVVAPDGTVTPDLAGELPGRGLWVSADRTLLERAVKKNMFARAARAPVRAPADLADRVAALQRRRCLHLIGLARRAGQAVAGFEKVRAWLEAGRAAVLLAARDGAADGRAKLARLGGDVPVVAAFTAAELGGVFGRDIAVHAALAPGGLSRRLLDEAARLEGLTGTTAGRENGSAAATSV